MDIAPLRGLWYDVDSLRRTGVDAPAEAVTSPPYDVISPAEHHAFLERSPYNITRLTLGDEPGGASPYPRRADELSRWIDEGVLKEDATPGFCVYAIDYATPDTGERRRFLALLALGRQHSFDEGVVLPHEATFPKVVDDRLRLLDATRTHLEPISLLYADPNKKIDGILEAAAVGDPAIRVQARPDEVHSLWRLTDATTIAELQGLFAAQRPIIADGHHRYTMGHRFRTEVAPGAPGADWQPMTFANLHGEGLSILATHRLVKLDGTTAADALGLLESRLEPAPTPEERDLRIETADRTLDLCFPAALRKAASGAAATDYGLLEGVVLGQWLAGQVAEAGVSYFKEGTGERDALDRGEGDILFRMQPVGRDEFRAVVEGGDVYPHKTTYFYPKLWSGLVLWRMADV